ncbi:MAG: MBL fold metallo-hydrolase [bacterium]|nr:MBL fold metallo-hydrolase [bacterium]
MKKLNLWLALIIIAGVVWAGVVKHPAPDFRMYFLNVGQGDATYLSFPDGQDALVDGGPGDRVLTELGQVMPFWDKDLDLVVVTHNHSDHISGLVGVLKRYQVNEIWLSGAIHTSNQYLEMLRLIKNKKIPVKIVEEGEEKYFDQVKVRVVYPDENWQGRKPEDQHEATVVTRWTYGKFALLLTGDLGTAQIERITSSREIIKADILKVPHHGSATGLNKEFLEKISPKAAVISVGKNNSFGHPKQSILNLLKHYYIKTYRTDQNGRVEFESDGSGFNKI